MGPKNPKENEDTINSCAIMITYIALLRGINVSGKYPLKMDALKQLFITLCCQNVKSYIQSGNVVFQSKSTETDSLERAIRSSIKDDYGYDVFVFVLNKKKLLDLFYSNPFCNKVGIDISKLHLTLLQNLPKLKDIESVELFNKESHDEFEILGNSIYLYCPNGYGKTKLNTIFFEKKLRTSATTRNWKTISKLVEICQYYKEIL